MTVVSALILLASISKTRYPSSLLIVSSAQITAGSVHHEMDRLLNEHFLYTHRISELEIE
jgi:hypothetical protein